VTARRPAVFKPRIAVTGRHVFTTRQAASEAAFADA
jgi:hypothetical protein